MKKILLLLLLIYTRLLSAQNDDMLAQLPDEPTTDYTIATFKSNRIINGHSIENTAPGVLDFKIAHRFTPLRQGFYDFFGLDNANVRIGFDYGLTPRLMIGIGRGGREKIIDGFAKFKILRQSTGQVNMPVTLSYLLDGQIKTLKFSDTERDNKFESRLYYTHQLLLARKFSERLSLQLMPTLVHRNLVPTAGDKNDVLALGAGGRLKITKRMAINAEYYYVPEGQISQAYASSLSVGLEIETGGHVFSMHFTNSEDMTYKGFITETDEEWFFQNDENRLLSGIRFGFNISRVFTLRKPKKVDNG